MQARFHSLYWDLPGRPQSDGVATACGEDCRHLLESRVGNREYFLAQCREGIGK